MLLVHTIQCLQNGAVVLHDIFSDYQRGHLLQAEQVLCDIIAFLHAYTSRIGWKNLFQLITNYILCSETTNIQAANFCPSIQGGAKNVATKIFRRFLSNRLEF